MTTRTGKVLGYLFVIVIECLLVYTALWAISKGALIPPTEGTHSGKYVALFFVLFVGGIVNAIFSVFETFGERVAGRGLIISLAIAVSSMPYALVLATWLV